MRFLRTLVVTAACLVFAFALAIFIALAQYPVPSTIGDLNPSKPLDTDPVSQGAAAIRQVKAALIQSFGVSFYEGGPLDGTLKTGAVTSVNLGTGAVSNVQIANGAITFTKLAPELSQLRRFLFSVPNPSTFSNTTALTSLYTNSTPYVLTTNVLASGIIIFEANVLFINGTASDHRFGFAYYTNGFSANLGSSNVFVASHSRLTQPLFYVSGISTTPSSAYYIPTGGVTNDVFGVIDSADPTLQMQIISTVFSSYGGP